MGAETRNLAQNPHCILATGRNDLAEGVDLVAEGDAATPPPSSHPHRPGLGPHGVEPEGGPGQPWIVRPGAGQRGAVEVGGPGQRQQSRLPSRLAQFEQDIEPGRGVGVEQGKDALEMADGIGECQAGGGRPAVADGRGPHRRVGSGEGDGAVMGGKLGRVG